MQILAVSKKDQNSAVVSGEIAKRLEKTNPDTTDFYLMKFSSLASKPQLEKVTIKIVEKRRPTFTLLDANGNEVEG